SPTGTTAPIIKGSFTSDGRGLNCIARRPAAETPRIICCEKQWTATRPQRKSGPATMTKRCSVGTPARERLCPAICSPRRWKIPSSCSSDLGTENGEGRNHKRHKRHKKNKLFCASCAFCGFFRVQ